MATSLGTQLCERTERSRKASFWNVVMASYRNRLFQAADRGEDSLMDYVPQVLTKSARRMYDAGARSHKEGSLRVSLELFDEIDKISGQWNSWDDLVLIFEWD